MQSSTRSPAIPQPIKPVRQHPFGPPGRVSGGIGVVKAEAGGTLLIEAKLISGVRRDPPALRPEPDGRRNPTGGLQSSAWPSSAGCPSSFSLSWRWAFSGRSRARRRPPWCECRASRSSRPTAPTSSRKSGAATARRSADMRSSGASCSRAPNA